MAIQYDLIQQPLNKEDKLLRAQFVSKGTINTKQLIKWTSQSGGFHKGQIIGVLEILSETIIRFLEDGYDVQLGDLGFLSVSLSSRPVKTRKEIRAESIRFKKVNFRTSSQLRKRLQFAEKERVSKPVKRSSALTREQRIQKLKTYLDNKTCITRTEYTRITGTLKGKAMLDLNEFIKEGWLIRYGSGRTVVYLLNKQQE